MASERSTLVIHADGCCCILHAEPDPRALARALTDGARRTLAALIDLCPGEFDTTGLTKFPGDLKTVRIHLDTLGRLGLLARHESQERLGIYPTALARAVDSLLRS